MELTEYINHPERLDKDSLYELRSLLALYPYFQTARLLLLQNLYLLHDPSFDDELRRAAIYITDRLSTGSSIPAPARMKQRSLTASPHPLTLPSIMWHIFCRQKVRRCMRRLPSYADSSSLTRS